MIEKLFKKEKLNFKNLIFIGLYCMCSFFIYVYFSVTKNPQNTILLYYTFLTHFYLIIFDYRALRKLNYFCIWIIIALIHFVIYLNIKSNDTYAFINGHAASGFRATLLVLISFQIIRYISFEAQGMDFVIASRSGKMDDYNEREFTSLDIFLGMLLFIMIVVFNVL